MPRPSARRTLENAVRRQGFERVAGVDEVGRGCLAGPVVAAAVVLDPGRPVRGLRDSKLLTPAARERLYAEVVARAAAWALAAVGPGEIDRLDIHRASLQAMRDAVAALAPAPDFVLVDGFPIPDLPVGQRAVRGGDRRCAAIARRLDRGEGDARPADAHAAPGGPAVWVRPAQGLRDKAAPHGDAAVWLLAGPPALVPPAIAV